MNESSLCTGLRILEVGTDLGTAYAGWLFQRMGARVARLDHPVLASGAACDRNLPSFARNFEHLDSGKASPPDLPGGALAQPLDGLLAQIDILLLDRPMDFEAAVGTSLALMRERHPRLIVGVCDLLPERFEAQGAPASALDAQALSGIASAVGEPGRAPVPFPPGILECQAGANLAASVLMAVLGGLAEGRGERVDVALSQVLGYYAYGNALGQLPWGLKWYRAGSRCCGSGGSYPYVLLPCKDGLVCLICRARDEWARLVQAMGRPAWSELARYQDLRAMGTQYPQEVDELIKPWLAGLTRDELLAIGLEQSIPMAPVREFAQVLTTPQFTARGALETVSLKEGEAIAPSLPFRISSRTDSQASASACGIAQAADPTQPLAGLRVLDLGWVWSAPLVAGILSEFGAQVIKVEHAGRLDNMRLRGRPLRDDGTPMEGPSIELSPAFHQINHNKLGITLDLKDPAGLAMLKQLAGQSDVVIENMSPGALERAGAGYEALAALNPRLIMLSLSAAGQFGPGADMRAYAPVMSSFTGLEGLIGYPGEMPIGALNFGLGDPNAATHALVALMAALWRRQTSGRGCHIDLSQIECLLCCLAGPLMDASLGAPQPQPVGDRHPDLSPHGIYPARGTDQWIALAATDEAAWQALCRTMGPEGRTLEQTYGTPGSRLAHRGELNGAIADWTVRQERDTVCATLRRAGVAASPVLSVEQARRDSGFLWRGTLQQVVHPISGPESLMIAPWRFERIRAKIERSSPCLGEHNGQVFAAL